jgi:hypothetical protein
MRPNCRRSGLARQIPKAAFSYCAYSNHDRDRLNGGKMGDFRPTAFTSKMGSAAFGSPMTPTCRNGKDWVGSELTRRRVLDNPRRCPPVEQHRAEGTHP